MEETKVDRFNFLTRVYTKGKKDHKILRAILKIILVLMILFTLFVIMMEGISFKTLGRMLIFMVCTFFLIEKTKPTGGYSNVPVIIEFYHSELCIIHNDIDRNDKIGRRKESMTFKYSDINKIKYNTSISTIIIEGIPVEAIKRLDVPNSKEEINDYTERGEIKQVSLYLDAEYRERIINNLEIHTGLKLENLG